MPSKSPEIVGAAAARLIAIGARIRAQRKALRISATVAAEAAGLSRVTLHRIENGEPSVTIGAYFNVLAALGLDLAVTETGGTVQQREVSRQGWLPARVRLAEYPQLKQLAWQVQGLDELTPREALGIYERNWRHVDQAALLPSERELIDALRLAFGEVRPDV